MSVTASVGLFVLVSVVSLIVTWLFTNKCLVPMLELRQSSKSPRPKADGRPWEGI